MITEKIYETDGEKFEFEAEVVDSYEYNGRFATILTRTAFFPGGGGQEHDEGWLGDIRLDDVKEENGEIIHISEHKFGKGEKVRGKVDKDVRLPRMQGHSGEHIISGLICRKYGCNNVGFHMGKDDITIDFDGVLDREQLDMIENEANAVIYEDRKISINIYDSEKDTLPEYRSKKELKGLIRLVGIDDVDLCACCAPHFSSTAKIGIVKILDFIHYKGGVRLHLLCGKNALEDYRKKYLSGLQISMCLSVPQPDIAEGVKKLSDENGELRYKLGNVWRKYLSYLCDNAKPDENGNIILFDEGADAREVRYFANAAAEKYNCTAGMFSGNAKDGYQYIICSKIKNLRELAKSINTNLGGHGGGSPEMIQGFVKADEDSIRKVIAISAE